MAAVAAVYPQLKKLGAVVWAISTDSVFSHKVFKDVSPLARRVQYPLLSDRNQRISRAYRVLDEESGATMRATILIDPEGVIVSKLVYPEEVGRNIPEIVRLLEAIQFGRKTGLGVPANWVPGMPGVKRDIRLAGTI